MNKNGRYCIEMGVMKAVCCSGVVSPRCQIQILNPKDVVLERRVGSVGVMSLSSGRLKRMQMEEGLEWSSQIDDLQRVDDTVQQEGIEVRQYEGRLKGTPSPGENVFVKMYPKNVECDALAANELKMHSLLQPPHTESICDQLSFLIGGYETDVSQCLVFRRGGRVTTLGEYIQMASSALKSGTVVGSRDVWDVLDPRRAEAKRQKFIVHVLRQIALGVEFMHRHLKLHQSLGPESVTLSQLNETDMSRLSVQVRDLTFGVDASQEALSTGTTLEEIWDIASAYEETRRRIPSIDELWTRARKAGAWSQIAMSNYGIADDVLSMGLLFLYTLLSAFCTERVMDGPRLYRLVQTTFDSDLAQFRDYCREDERLEDALALLDKEGESGWELIQAMIQTDWKSRPTALSCSNHPFLNGSLFENEL